jgi:hypothetical protein
VGEGGEICDTFELQQKQGMILGRETRVSNNTQTLEDVLVVEAQANWIMLLSALKAN